MINLIHNHTYFFLKFVNDSPHWPIIRITCNFKYSNVHVNKERKKFN